MMRWRSDRSICLYIYLFTLAITVSYAIWRQVIMSDQAIEYALYLMSVKDGLIHLPANDIVGSCLTVTIVPALIQRVTHFDVDLVFKVWPCITYSLMPVFTYLISRKYMGKAYALLASCLVLSSFYFIYSPANGRVSIALGLLAGMLWGILNRHYKWALILGIGVIFSHYATTYIMLLLLGVVTIQNLVKGWKSLDAKWMGGVFVVLVAVTVVWHWGVVPASGYYAKSFLLNGIMSAETALPGSNTLIDNLPNREVLDFYKLESRDKVVQAAFGKFWPVMDVKQRFELVLSWTIVALISGGLLYAWLKKKVSTEHKIMATVMVSILVLTALIPYVSKTYVITRSYFTGLIVLAPLVSISVRDAAGKLRVNGIPILMGVISLYAMSTSGVITWLLK